MGAGIERCLIMSQPAHAAAVAGIADGVAAGTADAAAVTRLLGREPAGAYSVVVRRRDGSPSVIANDPWLSDGTPMPTRFWLVDPELRSAVSRLESAGGVRRAGAAVDAGVIDAAHRRYAAERDAVAWARATDAGSALVRPWPRGGVGGTRQGVKCLHAHLAWWLAGGDDAVGRWTAEELGLDRGQFERVGQ